MKAVPSSPVLPAEGRHVLHLFYRIDRSVWTYFSEEEKWEGRSRLVSVIEEIRAQPETQLLLLSGVTPKSDVGFMLLTPDLQFADEASKRLTASLGPEVLTPVFSWLSLTERSEYTTTEEEYTATLAPEDNVEEKRAAFRARMEKYGKDRLYPNLPDWPVVCFYPMSKRREAGQNWYSLDFAARKALMQGHARVGRTYSGRVLQLITGSTGLDDGEWGVTLFA
ncbi:MAG TPA: chlorite dismutase family protein, partial [Chthoniobacterales bacterium]